MKVAEKPFEKKVDKSADSDQEMQPKPVYEREYDRRAGKKLENKVAIITGGDSGIGKAVAIHFAREGADVAIVYRVHDEDAEETKKMIEEKGKKPLLIKKDITTEEACKQVIEEVVQKFGKLNILVNNVAVQYPEKNIEDLTEQQLRTTFDTNFFSYFFMTKHALKYLHEGDAIVNTASVNAYKGNAKLVDYSSTKGAIVSFTRSMAQSLAEKNIRINAVAPGPVWTPLVTSTFKGITPEEFGKNVFLKRPAQPAEIAPCFVFLASEDSSYITGQVIHPNGGTIVNS